MSYETAEPEIIAFARGLEHVSEVTRGHEPHKEKTLENRAYFFIVSGGIPKNDIFGEEVGKVLRKLYDNHKVDTSIYEFSRQVGEREEFFGEVIWQRSNLTKS